MIKSMTGYGNAAGVSGKLEISIELRSVNNRFLDCSIRIPRVYTAVEDGMKAMVQKYISRGKVDVYVTIDATKSDDVTISVNEPLSEAYVAAIRQLSEKYGIEDDLTAGALARFPDILKIEKAEEDTEALEKDICGILEEALRGFDEMRTREGGKLFNDISAHADEIERLTNLAEERSTVTVPEYREKLYQRMTEVLQSADVDENRILLEAALFADKVAVNEEVVRLRSHVSQLRHLISGAEPVGRKLDFIVQEMNREANTIGSKGNDGDMAKIVIDLKAEIEKIREQVQNVE
jgi:uncharacterized protein (TIGR00255 family)